MPLYLRSSYIDLIDMATGFLIDKCPYETNLFFIMTIIMGIS